MAKINILGQEYDYQEISPKQDTRLANTDGYMDGYAKLIRINNDYNENDPSSIRDFRRYKNKVIRHEIIHAFFQESGLTAYRDDEMFVDWMAIQLPKINKVLRLFKSLYDEEFKNEKEI